jgi:hypothetical protein
MAEGKVKESAPWEDYSESGPWDDFKDEGLIEKPLSGLPGKLSLLGEIGNIYDSAFPAPTRSAVQAYKEGKSPTEAFSKQFLRNPEGAPKGEEIIGYKGPGAGAAGFVTELALDPLNILTVGEFAKAPKAVEPYAAKAARAANEWRVKGIGAMKGAFKELDKKDLIQELGKYVKEMGFLKAGDSVEDVAQKTAASLTKTENGLSKIYSSIPDKFPGQDVAARAMQDLHMNFGANFGQGAKIADNPVFEKTAQEIIQKELEPLLGQDFNAKQLHNFRRDLDKKIKWSRSTNEMPEKQQALVSLRNSINDLLNDAANKLPGAGKDDLKRLNKEYSMTSRVDDIASDRLAANRANRAFSLTDYGAGTSAASSAMIGQTIANPDRMLQNLATSLAVGVGAAGANKAARRIGPGGVATFLDLLEKPLSFTDPVVNLMQQRKATTANILLKPGQAEAAKKRRLKALND